MYLQVQMMNSSYIFINLLFFLQIRPKKTDTSCNNMFCTENFVI